MLERPGHYPPHFPVAKSASAFLGHSSHTLLGKSIEDMLAHDHRNIVATAKWCSCPFPNLWAKGSSNKHGSAHLLKSDLQRCLATTGASPQADGTQYRLPCPLPSL